MHLHIKTSWLKSTLFPLLLLSTTITYSTAQESSPSQYVLINTLEGLLFPVLLPEPDIIKPLVPHFSISPPESTSENIVYVELSGEIGTQIIINGKTITTIDSSGRALIPLNTSGEEGIKYFTITLRDSAGNLSDALNISIEKIPDPKFDISYKGLTFYYENLSTEDYHLKPLDDATFNSLSNTQKQQVAQTLLSSLFFGYTKEVLDKKINSAHFLENIRLGLEEERTDKANIESYISDEEKFYQSEWSEYQTTHILSRFYAMKELDRYFLNNWIAYILTQTIMFSPAYELDTSHRPNIANVYNRIVTFLNEESGMRYITYVHMMSEDNWRRFRSPEDNGREMLEIFLQDQDDRHVPIAAKALQNWKLNTDNDTLEVSLNENQDPLKLFDTVIINGDDFYRELVKSSDFTHGVTRRLVDFFFTEATESKKINITQSIVDSNPQTWQDILLQIVFSEEYLLHTKRVRSMEESFYSYTKKISYRHQYWTFSSFKTALENMHQASMHYKLGKLNRVPTDVLSFAYTHKYLREEIFMRHSNDLYVDDYRSWARQGWSDNFTDISHFKFNEEEKVETLHQFIQYLFHSIISRDATQKELDFFTQHMTYEEDEEIKFYWAFNMFASYDDAEEEILKRKERRRDIAITVLDYLSRLESTYTQNEVK
jgi:hypothetical protein